MPLEVLDRALVLFSCGAAGESARLRRLLVLGLISAGRDAAQTVPLRLSLPSLLRFLPRVLFPQILSQLQIINRPNLGDRASPSPLDQYRVEARADGIGGLRDPDPVGELKVFARWTHGDQVSVVDVRKQHELMW